MIAFALGMLVREMAIRFEVIAGYTRKGGSRKKRLPAVGSFIRSRLRTTRSLTAAALWRQIPRDTDDSSRRALRIGKLRLLIEGNRLVVKKLQALKHEGGKEWRGIASLTYPSFRKYVTDVRKSIRH